MSTKTVFTPDSAKAKVSDIMVQLQSLQASLKEVKGENPGDRFLDNIIRAVENAHNTLQEASAILLEKYKIASVTSIDESLNKIASVLNNVK